MHDLTGSSRERLLTASLVALALSLAAPAEAQECDCDHTFAPDVTSIDGEAMGIGPGDVVCLTGGEREFLRLSRFIGTAEAPIVVTSCGSVVTIRNTTRAYALVVEGQSQHVRVTGSHVDGAEHGIRVSAPAREPYPGVGVWLQGRSSDMEVDHVEVFETGFAGVMAKTDPSCDDRAVWDGFVMRNVHLHHLWVHDTGGEGFYVGSTQSDGYVRDCGGSVTIPAHFLENVEIDHVLVEDTGWDGAQIGFARSGCSFHDNVIRRVGSEGVEYQQQGLQIGAYSSCEVRRNVLSDGPVMGIIVLDSGDSLFADNVIARFAGDGIYANLRGLVETASYRVVHNTIVSFGGDAIQMFGDGIEGATAHNNFVIGGDESSIGAGGDVGFASEGNVFVGTIAAAGVLGENDFHLAEGSPARGAATDLTAMGFATDLDGRGRAMPPSAGAYEYDEDVVIVPDAGASIGRDGGTSSAAPGGCACRAGARGGDTNVLVALSLTALIVAARARRRHRRAMY